MCVQRQDIGSGWGSMLMDSSLLVLCLLWSRPAPGSGVMERDAGSSLEAYLVSDQGF